MRRAGYVPAVIYGRGGEDVLAVSEYDFMRNIGHSSPGVITLSGLGAPVSVLIKEVQWDVLSGRPTHIDFYRVELDQIVSVRVPIRLTGTPKGALFGGVLDHIQHDLPIRVKASDIPSVIMVDITELGIGDAFHVSDLVLPDGVISDMPGEAPVVHVVAPTVEKTPVAEEGAEGVEGEGAEVAEDKEEEKKE